MINALEAHNTVTVAAMKGQADRGHSVVRRARARRRGPEQDVPAGGTGPLKAPATVAEG